MVAYMENARKRPSFATTIPQIRVPTLLYAGGEDANCCEPSRRVAALPAGQFVCLPGLKHAGASSVTAMRMPGVLAFLAAVGI